jgi:predicted RNA-binding protein with PIN domain
MPASPQKILLVDGYNVLRTDARYAHLITSTTPDHTSDPFNAAREALLTDVATFAGRAYDATVVFDGAGNPASTGESIQYAGITLIFSAAGTSADTVIEAAARQAAHANKEVLVVSSDAAMQWTVLGRRVQRMSAVGFCAALDVIDQELKEFRAPGAATVPTAKTTLADRLDPKTRAALRRLMRP